MRFRLSHIIFAYSLSAFALVAALSCSTNPAQEYGSETPVSLSPTSVEESLDTSEPVEIEEPESADTGEETGSNIFGEDRIITIELDFAQNDFFQVLLENHETSEYIEADLTIIDASGTHFYENVGVRLKGNSSMSHPGNKKPFKIDFNEFVIGQDHDGLKKLNFSNAFKDPSFLHEKIFFDVSRAAGVQAPRTNFANVYFNGELWGFYTVVEQIDDRFLERNFGDDNGNLFKSTSEGSADLQYRGPDQRNYEGSYAIKNNEEVNDWSDLIEFTDFITNSPIQVFENEIDQWLNVQGFLRSAALDNLFSNLDSYTLSGRNYYLYHNMESGLWEWIKWDGNEAFGAYAYGVNEPMTALPVTFAESHKALLQKIFESETLTERYLNEVCVLVEDLFNPAEMNSRIDELSELVDSSVLADPNKMYPYENFVENLERDISVQDPFIKREEGPPGMKSRSESEIPPMFGLKSFVAEKHAYVTSTLACN